MVSVREALALIKKNTFGSGKTEHLAVDLAGGYVLSKDLHAPIDLPPFRRSAMDGYALCFSAGDRYKVVGEVKAGNAPMVALRPGDAVRIFTGAQVPDTAHAVVMQEKVTVKENTMLLESPCRQGENIRPQGEEVARGNVALPQRTLLTPAAIGFVAGMGIEEVEVFSKPTIAIVTTGDELETPGKTLTAGKVYESNACMLQSALTKTGYPFITTYRAEDNLLSTREAIQNALLKSDMVLISGGISVGDYDFSGKALKEIGVRTVFHKVNQKPGKPLYFGVAQQNKPVFALPGNPASVLTCFYVYVHPLLRHWEGNKTAAYLHMLSLPCRSYVEKKKNYTLFLKARIERSAISILEGQNSSMLHTYALANALAVIPENVFEVQEGSVVDVIPLP